ncbi:hypothetical protein L195_g048660, partial [Trifolium pratense]
SLIACDRDAAPCCNASESSYMNRDRACDYEAMVVHREKSENQEWKLFCYGVVGFANPCHSFFLPLGALSDVESSPQSILRYLLTLPPVCALLPVKAVTDTAALRKP